MILAPAPEEASVPLTKKYPSCQVVKELQAIQPVYVIDKELVGKWCVVVYDDDPFPGIIQDVDSQSGAKVKTMSSVGINRFCWPPRDDIIWYEEQNILGLIPEPQPVTARHMRVSESVWRELCARFD